MNNRHNIGIYSNKPIYYNVMILGADNLKWLKSPINTWIQLRLGWNGVLYFEKLLILFIVILKLYQIIFEIIYSLCH